MKITRIDSKQEGTGTCVLKKAIITGEIETENIETLQNLDADTIDTSDAIAKTQAGFKSIKNASVFICPKNTKELEKFFMSFCPSLHKVIIPASTSKIGERAFCYCEKLRYIDVDPNNATFTSVDGVLFSKDRKKLIRCPEGVINSYTVPEGVTEIAERAFYGCNGIKTIVLPPSITHIGESAFQQCEGLQSINIPDNVTVLNKNLFFGCTRLRDIKFPTRLTSIQKNVFYSCLNLDSINLPSTMQNITKDSFECCPNLTRISVSSGGALQNSGNALIEVDNKKVVFFPTKVESYTIEEGIETVGISAFEQTEIQNITFCSTIKKIEQNAFRACYNLTEITLPQHLSSIEDRAFDSCVNLMSITCNASIPPFAEESSFLFMPLDDCTLYVPAESVDSYKNSNGWCLFKHILPQK